MTADTAAAPSGVAAPGPGVYDIPAETYHADTVSLSSSGARKLLESPAKFRYEQDHPQPPKKAFDFGTAAHKEVLGVGPELLIVDADDWKTKAAQTERDEAYARDAVPLLRREYEQVRAMAKALHGHPVARVLFEPGSGVAEQSFYWLDRRTEVMRRARLDWCPHPDRFPRLIIPDYKSARDASTRAIEKAIFEYGYFQQGPWYMDAARAWVADDVAFVLVVQEKTPPYLVNVVEMTPDAVRLGTRLNRRAIDLFAECRATGVWPGYGDDIKHVSLPPWAEKQVEELL
jgi:hypothetical protein